MTAHVGGAATAACGDIGANAYAMGDHVAFSSSPSLHTAAHEAAHVIQQRSGVALDQGVGQRGDPYERHADAVADAVVAGGSAESLLDQLPVGAGATSEAAPEVREDQPVASDAQSLADVADVADDAGDDARISQHGDPSEPRPGEDAGAAQPPETAQSAETARQPETAQSSASDRPRTTRGSPELAGAPTANRDRATAASGAADGSAPPTLPGLTSVAAQLAATPPTALRGVLADARSAATQVRSEQDHVLHANAPAPEPPPAARAPRSATQAAVPAPGPALSPRNEGAPAEHVARQAAVGRQALAAQPEPVSAGPRPSVPLVGAADPACIRAAAATQVDSTAQLRRQVEGRAQASARDVPAVPATPVAAALPCAAGSELTLPPAPPEIPSFARDALQSGRGPELLARASSQSQARPQGQASPPGPSSPQGQASFPGDVPVPSRPAEPADSPHRASRRADASPQAESLAQGLLQAADAQLATTTRGALGAFKSAEQQHREQTAQMRTSTETRMQSGLSQMQGRAHTERAQVLERVQQKRETLHRRNQDAEANLARRTAALQTDVEGSITTTTTTRERRAAEALSRGELEAMQLRSQAKADSAALLARADAGPAAQPVQRQDADGTEEPASLRARARQILEAAIATAFRALDNARTASDEEVTTAANQVATQIGDYRARLEAYRQLIGSEMAQNGAVVEEEIANALALYDDMMSQYFDESGQLIADQVDEFRDWWVANGATLEGSLTGAMDEIDGMANMLEPMYEYSRANPGVFTAQNVEWTRIDTSFMSGATGYDAGDLYLPYHNDASVLYEAGNLDALFPWEGMAAMATAEHRTLHPWYAPSNDPAEVNFFGQHWIPEAIGIYQTMIMRSNPESWGNFPLDTVRGMEGYQPYPNAYASPNAAALEPSQYLATPVFLEDFGDNSQPTEIGQIHRRGVAEDYYALAAAMYFTGLHIEQPFDSYDHRDTSSDLRGGDGLGEITTVGSDRTYFGNYVDGDFQPLDLQISDPRVVDGQFHNTYDMDVEPEHVGGEQQEPRPTALGGEGRLRSGPGFSYPAAQLVASGTTVSVLSSYGEWRFVDVNGDGAGDGWMHNSIVP